MALAAIFSWFVLASVSPPRTAQDAIPLIVAGELVTSEPESVYVDAEQGAIREVQPAFGRRACEILQPGMSCEVHTVAFVSPPGALPLAAGLAWLGPEQGLRVLAGVTSAAAAAGTVVLWDRLGHHGQRTRWMLALSAAAMTPLVDLAADLGQTTQLLYLSVVLGTGTFVAGRRAALGGVVWAGTVLVKASPLALGTVLVVQRRWRMLGWGLAVLVVTHLMAAAMGGWDLLGSFVGSISAVRHEAAISGANGGFEAALFRLPGADLSVRTAEQLAWALRLLAVASAAVGFFRIRDHDVQWAFAWAVLVALLPISWWHYALVSFGALGVAVARTARPARWTWVLPAFSAVGLPMSIANSRAWSLPTAQALATVAAAVGVYLLGRTATSAQRPDDVADGVACDRAA